MTKLCISIEWMFFGKDCNLLLTGRTYNFHGERRERDGKREKERRKERERDKVRK